jgi:hypothetical protein
LHFSRIIEESLPPQSAGERRVVAAGSTSLSSASPVSYVPLYFAADLINQLGLLVQLSDFIDLKKSVASCRC